MILRCLNNNPGYDFVHAFAAKTEFMSDETSVKVMIHGETRYSKPKESSHRSLSVEKDVINKLNLTAREYRNGKNLIFLFQKYNLDVAFDANQVVFDIDNKRVLFLDDELKKRCMSQSFNNFYN